MADAPVHEVKKYPNRRFYDVTDRRHVTLADLHRIVRRGGRIVVTDSRTGEDITNVVLTQIILEHDPPKMDLFPASLLHQTLQANQQVVRRFIDEYFAQAMNAFIESGKRFEEFLQRSGLSFMRPPPMDWARGFLGGMGVAPPSTSDSAPDGPEAAIRAMRERIDAMSAELAELRARRTTKQPRRSGRPKSKKGPRRQ